MITITSCPGELIAQHPLPQREDSRMMVVHRDRKKSNTRVLLI